MPTWSSSVSGSAVLRSRRAESQLRVVERFGNLGAPRPRLPYTRMTASMRILIVTDERASAGWHGQEPTKAVPAHVPV